MGGFNLNMPGLTPQPISGDSLTQYWRSLTNQMGNTGGQFLSAGVPTTNTGIGYAGQGMDTFGKALSTLDPSVSYWNAILSGDPKALTAATAPTANALSSIYSGATNTASMDTPAGGYRSASLAALPQSYASQVGNYLLNLQPTAANALNTIAGTQAGIGAGQGQLGLGVGQLGLGQSGLGANIQQSALASLLQKLGINQQATNSNMQALSSGLSSYANASSYFSDELLKEGVIPIGTVKGLPVYIFRYKNSDEVRMGVIAQEARELVPEAVEEDRSGYLRVDYDLLFNKLNLKAA